MRLPTRAARASARISYQTLKRDISRIKEDFTEIELEDTQTKLRIPTEALQILSEVLKAMSEGKPVSIVPIAAELSTQKAAEILGCSRPHLVKLLEAGELSYTKVGKHRRLKMEEVIKYRSAFKQKQKQLLNEIIELDEELGLYDSSASNSKRVG